MSCEELIGLYKYTATQGFLLVPISWYRRDEWKEIAGGYRRYFQFPIAFASWVNVLLDVLKLSNFLSFDPVPENTIIICLWFQTIKNDWAWGKVFGRFITILDVSVNIIGVLCFQLVSIFKKLDCNLEIFFAEKLQMFNNTLIRYTRVILG